MKSSKTAMASRLRETVRHLERIMGLLNEGEMRCCGISLAQCHALVEIGRAGTLSLGALACLVNLDASTTSRTVQNLVTAGLARREPDPADRRAVVIALAPEGQTLYRSIESGMKTQYHAILDRIPPDRRDCVLEGLELLLGAMTPDSMMGTCAPPVMENPDAQEMEANIASQAQQIENAADKHPLLDHLADVQATDAVLRRIRATLDVTADDVLAWCRSRMEDPESLTNSGGCWHVRWDGAVLAIGVSDLQIRSVRREKSKKGSDLSDVNLVRNLDDLPEEKAVLVAAFDRKTHRRVSRYGVLLADHVLSMAGLSRTGLLEECCAVNRRWQDGGAHFQEARDLAFEMHELARSEPDPVKEKGYRTMGQIAAIPHVKRHALIASDYAVKVVNLLHPGDKAAIRAERAWQIQAMSQV